MNNEQNNPNLVSFTLRGAGQYRAMEAAIKAHYARSDRLRDMKFHLTISASGTNPQNPTIHPHIQEFQINYLGQDVMPSRTIAKLVASTNIASVILDKTDPDFPALRELVRKVKQQEISPPPAKIEKPSPLRITRLEKVMERGMRPSDVNGRNEIDDLQNMRNIRAESMLVVKMLQDNLHVLGTQNKSFMIPYSDDAVLAARSYLQSRVNPSDPNADVDKAIAFLNSRIRNTTPDHTPYGGRILRFSAAKSEPNAR